jgi:hypothetical protein
LVIGILSEIGGDSHSHCIRFPTPEVVMVRSAAVLLLAAVFAQAEEKPKGENPYRECKQGDWIEAKGSNGVVVKHTVVAKTKDEVRIKIEQTVPGVKSEPIEQIVHLNLPYPLPVEPNKDFEYKTTQEKLESGTETLTIGDKKYECEWDKVRHTTVTKFMDKETKFMSTSKVWRCKDVPLNWPVRSETETEGGYATMFLLDIDNLQAYAIKIRQN